MESKLNNKKEFSDRIIKAISKGDLDFLNEYGIQKDILQKILQQSIIFKRNIKQYVQNRGSCNKHQTGKRGSI